jgi:uncharacterized membrane protein SirB2
MLLQKDFLIEFFNKYEKKFMDKNLFLGGIELLKVFNIISVSNQSPLVTWQGPDIINYISFKTDDFYEMSK